MKCSEKKKKERKEFAVGVVGGVVNISIITGIIRRPYPPSISAHMLHTASFVLSERWLPHHSAAEPSKKADRRIANPYQFKSHTSSNRITIEYDSMSEADIEEIEEAQPSQDLAPLLLLPPKPPPSPNNGVSDVPSTIVVSSQVPTKCPSRPQRVQTFASCQSSLRSKSIF